MKKLLLIFCFYSTLIFAQQGFEKTYSAFNSPEMSFVGQLTGGGYILCGRCSSNADNTTDFCFLRIDNAGNIVWTKQYHDSTYLPWLSLNEEAIVIREKQDGSFIFGGGVKDPNYSGGGAYFGWLDSAGNLQHSIIKSATWTSYINDMILNADGSIASTRYANEGAGHHHFNLEICDSSAQYTGGGGSGNYEITKHSLAKMTDGGYGTLSMQEDNDNPNYILYGLYPVVSRFDANGNLIYSRMPQNEVYVSDTHYTSLCATPDTGIMVCGFVSNTNSIFITRFNSAGDSVWSTFITGFPDQYPVKIVATSDGGYAIAGRRTGDILLLKMDSNGNIAWSKTFGGPYTDDAIYFSQTSDNGFIILGKTASFGPETIYLVKTDSMGNINPSVTQIKNTDPENIFAVYPDPFSSVISLIIPGNKSGTLNVFDITGRKVFSVKVPEEIMTVNLSFLPSGAYFAEFSSNKINCIKKILKE